MGLIAKEMGGGKDFDPLPEGIHLGVCYAVVDIGTHHNDNLVHLTFADGTQASILSTGRACYVNLGQAPLAIWRRYQSG